LRPRASHQTFSAHFAPRPRRHLHIHLPLLRPLFRDSRHPGHALPHPICGPGGGAPPAAPALGGRPLALPHVALSCAGAARNRGMDRNLHFDWSETDAGLACGDGSRYPCIFGARAAAASVAIRGGRLIKICRARLQARFVAPLLCVLAAPALAPRHARASAQSLPETVEAINKSRVSTRILFITAHPDDEWSSLLAYLSHGLNADVGLLTITRGQGGQNAIGPEQGGPLGVIRTEELLAAGKFYGVRQFFTRAPDTGYLKSAEQAKQIWGDVALEDMVRVLRTYRPQVVINGWGGVRGGHGHHQESGVLTPQAVAAAADPKMFPQQLAEGLVVWKVTLVVRPARGSTVGAVELPTNDVSPLWGKSYVELGMEGHSNHRSQGTPAFFGNSFFRRPVYLIRENEKGEPAGPFDVKLLAEPITSLSNRFPKHEPEARSALEAVELALKMAEKDVLDLDRAAAAKALAKAAKELVALRKILIVQPGADDAAGLWELNRITDRINLALGEDFAFTFEVQADRHELVAGESFSVQVTLPGRSAVPVKWTL